VKFPGELVDAGFQLLLGKRNTSSPATSNKKPATTPKLTSQ
jgi:hypothetical protein